MAGIKLVGVSQYKPMYVFLLNLKVSLSQEGLELIKFWGVSGHNCSHGNTLKIFVS